MDDIRAPFSSMTKKIKHRLMGKKHKQDITAADTPGETTDSTTLLPRSEAHDVAGGGQDRGGNGANADGKQAHSTDLGRREVDTQRHSDVDSAMGSRRSGEAGLACPSPPTPIPNNGKPDSM